MATQQPKQLDAWKKPARKDEATRKKIEPELQKKRVALDNQAQAAASARNSNVTAAVKGTLAALKPAPILTMPETATVIETCQLCAAQKTTCALVMDEGRLVGIVTSQDLTYRVVAEGLDPRTTLVRHIMTLDPAVMLESSTVASGLELMISKNINHLPVTDEDGKIIGVVDFLEVFFEILSHAYRKASASDQLLTVMAALGAVGANKSLVAWAESVRHKTALPDLSSIVSTRTQPITVGPKVSVCEVAQLMRDRYVTAVCVMDEAEVPHLSGIFTTDDVVLRVVAEEQDAGRCSVVTVMTPQPDTISLLSGIYDVVHMMHNGSYSHLPVVHDDDRLVAVFDLQVLAKAAQEQLKEVNQEIAEAPHSVSDPRSSDSLSVVHPTDRVAVMRNKLAGPHGVQESATSFNGPLADVEDFNFKFRTPWGMNYRLSAAPDDYEGLKASIIKVLQTDLMFETDTSGIHSDPRDFRISYIDSDDDQVFISSDENVLDSVKVAREASSDRVFLFLHGGKSWATLIDKQVTERPAPTHALPPLAPTGNEPDTPPAPNSEPPRMVDIVETVQGAPSGHTSTYEPEGPSFPGDSEQEYSRDPDPTTPSQEILRANLGTGSSKAPAVFTDEKKRYVRESAAVNNAGALITHFTDVFSDVDRYRQLLVKARGDGAQKLLDTFQTLLDTPGLEGAFRRNLLVAIQRLSARSGHYPTCYAVQDVELIDEHPVAAGSFADIHRGRYFGQVVCLKVIRIYQTSDVRLFLKQFSSEAILWGHLSHPNILPFYGLYLYEKRLCSICPWLNNGNINEYLHHHPDQKRTLLISDIAHGIDYLHENDIIHGDIKGTNILVDGSGRACLSDFGISALTDPSILHWSSQSYVGSTGGSTRWQAPELFDVDADEVIHNTKASDIYSYGCIVYEVFSGNAPFAEITRESAVMIKVRSGSHPARPHPLSSPWKLWGLTEHIWSLMESCWNFQPEKRPNISSIISEHQFTSLLDDRPRDADEILSPANFRNSSTRATLPSVADIEAILDVDVDSGASSVSHLLPDSTAQDVGSLAVEQVTHDIATEQGSSYEPSLASSPTTHERPLLPNDILDLSPQLEELQLDIATTGDIPLGEPSDDLKSVVSRLSAIFKDIEKYKQLFQLHDTETQKLLNVFQLLLDSPGISAEFRRQLLVATQRVSRSTGLYPVWFKLEDVNSTGADFVTDGGFADVYRGDFRGRSVCLKVIRLRQSSQMDIFRKLFSSEAILWGQLSHVNVLPIYGLCHHINRLCLVSPWMENGDINNFLDHHPHTNRKLLVLDIASGVAYLHDHDIIHGDLKGANILVDKSGRACVADFGLSAVSDPNILHWTSFSLPVSKGGSVRWQAPELFDQEKDDIVCNTKETDIYALVSVAYEILTGKIPFFEHRLEAAVIARIQTGAKPSRPPLSSSAWKTWGLTESFWALMQAGWSPNPGDRPTIQQILAQDELQGLRDERPTVAVDNIFSARFRDSMFTGPKTSGMESIERLLDGILSTII